MKKLAVTLAACTLSLAGAASAQTSNGLNFSTDNGLLYEFSAQNLGPLLTSYGYTYEVDTLLGQTALRVSDGYYTMGLMPTACGDGSKCVGLAMFAFFGQGGSLAMNNQFNNNTFFASVEQWDGTNVMERYLISDYGYSKGSLEVDLAVFFAVIDDYVGYLNDMATSVSYSADAGAEAPGKIANVQSAAAGEAVTHELSKSDLRSVMLEIFPDMSNEFNGFKSLIEE